jgi:hypothetical protein
VLGQSAAGLHVLKHFASKSDATGAPAQHVQLCLECASFAPLAGAHGGHAQSLVVDFVAAGSPVALADVAIAPTRESRPFQARAPPR